MQSQFCLRLSDLFIVRYSCRPVTIYSVINLLMARKANIRKSKCDKSSNPENGSLVVIAAGNHEEHDHEHRVQIMQTLD